MAIYKVAQNSHGDICDGAGYKAQKQNLQFRNTKNVISDFNEW